MDSKGARTVENLIEAATYIPSQVNNLTFVKGFTPNQWVTGRSPMQTTSLTADLFNPGHRRGYGLRHTSEEKVGSSRGVFEGGYGRTSQKSHEQQLQGEQGPNPRHWSEMLVLADSGTGILQKNQWRGPARVVAHERDDEGQPCVIWVTHGTHLIRCAPHQVRPLVEDTGAAPVANPEEALSDLQALRAKSTTQYRDVFDGDPVLEDNAREDAPPPPPPVPDLPDYNDLFGSDVDMEPSDDVINPEVPGAVLLYQQRLSHRRLVSLAGA